MKILIRDVLYFHLVFLLLLTHFNMSAFLGKTYVAYRSQSDNSARLWAGWPMTRVIDEQARAESEQVTYAFAVTPEYTQTFRAEKIAQYFFGCHDVAVTGSRSGNRGVTDILADYLGLPADYRSTLSFKPSIKNFLVDFFWHVDFGCLAEGLSFFVHAPLVYTKWNLNMCEKVQTPGTMFQPAGYIAPVRVDRSQLVATAKDFFAGGKTFGDMQSPLKYGLIGCNQTKVRLADIQAFLQWDFFHRHDCRVGFELFGAAPTGNRPENVYLFEPIVGNGKYWQLGFGLNGYMPMWESQRSNRVSGLFWQLLVSHYFKSDQYRSFDFKRNGPGSRYMLLEEIRTPVCALRVPLGVRPPNEYQGRLFTAINKTTLACSVSVPVIVDALFKMQWRVCGFDAEIGYNLWFRMAERLACRQPFKANRYAAKGDAQIYGFNPAQEAIALNATESQATLYAGQGVGNFASGVQFTNANIDNPSPAFDSAGNPLSQLNAADSVALGIAAAQVNTSNPAILLSDSDIDECSGLSSKFISNKLFFNVGYAGQEHNNCWVPYFSVGGEAEFACFGFRVNSAISQWGLWLKGGISY